MMRGVSGGHMVGKVAAGGAGGARRTVQDREGWISRASGQPVWWSVVCYCCYSSGEDDLAQKGMW